MGSSSSSSSNSVGGSHSEHIIFVHVEKARDIHTYIYINKYTYVHVNDIVYGCISLAFSTCTNIICLL